MSRIRQWFRANSQIGPRSAAVLFLLALVVCALVVLNVAGKEMLALVVLLCVLPLQLAIATILPPRKKRIHEQVVLPFSCAAVWNLISPAENAPLIEPAIVRGRRVEHTPEGVGEHQEFENVDGTTSVVEVLEWVPDRGATIRLLTPVPALPMRVEFVLSPVGSGSCSYDHTFEFEVPRGWRFNRAYERQLRTGMTEMFDRITAALSST